MLTTLDELRRFTVARNFFNPTTLNQALQRMGFVQADPIRAPARAQDLILRHRVKNYRAGDIERQYAKLDIEEDFFVNYGYVTRRLQSLMHPRSQSRVPADDVGRPWPAAQRYRAQLLLEFVRERGEVHPREVDEHFSHGRVTNYWGGGSNATTHLLDAMHYTGMLRVTRREKGIRLFGAHQHEPAPKRSAERRTRIDALVDTVVGIYAPLPSSSLSFYIRRLRYASPQWKDDLKSALERAKERLSHTVVEGVNWYWPSTENALVEQAMSTSSSTGSTEERVRFVAPFDPLVHDRMRFEVLWGWVYRFEAYTPAAKRRLGYYAMPLLWRDRVIGWANLSIEAGQLKSDLGYVKSQPRDRTFKMQLEAEFERMRAFLRLTER
jgi:uncharacterized protein YcaQ